MCPPPPDPTPMDPALEAEIEAALGKMSLSDIDTPTTKTPKPARGARPEREGTVVQIRGSDVLVEFGPRNSGVCPLAAFDAPPALGSKHPFTIERREADDGMLILSRKGTISKAKWQDVAEGQIIEAICTGTNKGGLELDVSGHNAFMPAGQVDIRHIDDLSDFVGKKLACEVLEMDRQRGRMILSRRSVLHEERKKRAQQVLATLEKGQTHDGVVTSVQQYGVFVDIGGVDGLVHVSDMSWDRIKNPGDKSQIRMFWKHDGRIKSRVDLDVGTSPGWRTWSRKTMTASDAGDWTVEVRTWDGRLLDTVEFEVTTDAFARSDHSDEN